MSDGSEDQTGRGKGGGRTRVAGDALVVLLLDAAAEEVRAAAAGMALQAESVPRGPYAPLPGARGRSCRKKKK